MRSFPTALFVFIVGAASHGRADISGSSNFLPWPLRITYCRLPFKFSLLSPRYFTISTRAVTYMMPNMQDISAVYPDQLLSSQSNGPQVSQVSILSCSFNIFFRLNSSGQFAESVPMAFVSYPLYRSSLRSISIVRSLWQRMQCIDI